MYVRRMSYTDAIQAWEQKVEQVANAERELVAARRDERQAQAEVFFALHMEANGVEAPQ
jgi:hypothetical protein